MGLAVFNSFGIDLAFLIHSLFAGLIVSLPLLILLAKSWDTLTHIVAMVREQTRFRAAPEVVIDPEPTEIKRLSWWSLRKAGFDCNRPPDPLTDPTSNLTGTPWRQLKKGSLVIPFIRRHRGSTDWGPQHEVRLTAYCDLIGKKHRRRSTVRGHPFCRYQRLRDHSQHQQTSYAIRSSPQRSRQVSGTPRGRHTTHKSVGRQPLYGLPTRQASNLSARNIRHHSKRQTALRMHRQKWRSGRQNLRRIPLHLRRPFPLDAAPQRHGCSWHCTRRLKARGSASRFSAPSI